MVFYCLWLTSKTIWLLDELHSVCGHCQHPIHHEHLTSPSAPWWLCTLVWVGSTMGGVWMLKYLTAWHQAWHCVIHVRQGSVTPLLTVLTELCVYKASRGWGRSCLDNVNGFLIPLCRHFGCITRNQNLIPHQIPLGSKSALCQEEKPLNIHYSATLKGVGIYNTWSPELRA